MTASLTFPTPLHHELTQQQWEEILTWCAEQQASDIVLCPDDKIWMQKDGIWHAVSDSCITDAEIQYMVNVTSGQSNRAGYVRAGHSLDYAFGLRVPGQRGVRQRFRVNATSSNKGIYVVLRILPRAIPVLEDMQLPDELVQNLYPDAGLVVISGVMGSGKSTLLAAVLHRALLEGSPARQILTLEDPIEFDFSSIPCQERSAPITQSAIGVDVEDWAGGVRTLTRRKGEIVMVGECRDRETISSLLSTVEQGVAAYTTVHAQDVAQTMTRIIHLFRKEERDSAMAVLFASIRLIIHQRLVPRNAEAGKPGRTALREYLVCDRDIRMRLYDLEAARLIEGVRQLVASCGHSLVQDARDKYGMGLIDGDVLKSIVHEQEGRSSAKGFVRSTMQGNASGSAPYIPQGIVHGRYQGSSQNRGFQARNFQAGTTGQASSTGPARPDAMPFASPSGSPSVSLYGSPSPSPSMPSSDSLSGRTSGIAPSGKAPSGSVHSGHFAQGSSFPGAGHIVAPYSGATHIGAQHIGAPYSGAQPGVQPGVQSGAQQSRIQHPEAQQSGPSCSASSWQKPHILVAKRTGTSNAASPAAAGSKLPGSCQASEHSSHQASNQASEQALNQAMPGAVAPIRIIFRTQGSGTNP